MTTSHPPLFLGLATFYILTDPFLTQPYFSWALCTTTDPSWQLSCTTYQIIRDFASPTGWKRWVNRGTLTSFDGFVGLIQLADLSGVGVDEEALGKWIEEIEPKGGMMVATARMKMKLLGLSGAVRDPTAMGMGPGGKLGLSPLFPKIVNPTITTMEDEQDGRSDSSTPSPPPGPHPSTLPTYTLTTQTRKGLISIGPPIPPAAAMDEGWSCLSWCLSAILSMADGGMIELACTEDKLYRTVLGKCKDILLMRQDGSYRELFPIVDIAEFSATTRIPR